jgi:hypothetical protein
MWSWNRWPVILAPCRVTRVRVVLRCLVLGVVVRVCVPLIAWSCHTLGMGGAMERLLLLLVAIALLLGL